MGKTISLLLLYFLGVLALIYVFAVIPGKKKNRQVRAMHDAVKAGDEIITIGGIFGTVLSRDGDEVVVQIDSNGTTMRILIFAVQSIRTSAGTSGS